MQTSSSFPSSVYSSSLPFFFFLSSSLYDSHFGQPKHLTEKRVDGYEIPAVQSMRHRSKTSNIYPSAFDLSGRLCQDGARSAAYILSTLHFPSSLAISVYSGTSGPTLISYLCLFHPLMLSMYTHTYPVRAGGVHVVPL